jgi:RNA polymerase sigma-70 factor (ECF subfamily)
MQGAEAIALERAREGDAEAFRMLVEQYSHKVFRLGYRLTGNEQDAEDVVQEAFLRAYRQLDKYESRAQFSSWLYRIASNYAIDLLRRRRRWGESGLDQHEEHSPLTSIEPGADRRLFGVEVQQRIDKAMFRLTAKERVAFTLRHYEGLSIKEISRVLSTRENTTKNHIFRAVRKLRQALEPMVDGR